MLTTLEGNIAEFIGVTSSVRKSSLFLIFCNNGFLDLLCIVRIIGLPESKASVRASLNSGDSETSLPTSSTIIKSLFSTASLTDFVAILLTTDNCIPRLTGSSS